MPPFRKLLTICTAALALVSVTAAPALADRNWQRGNGIAYKQGFRNGAFNANRHFNNQFDRRGFNNRGFNRNFNNRRFNNRGGLNGAEAAVIGVGAGLLSLALINNSRQNRQPNTVVVREQVVVQPQQVVTGYPQPAYNPNLPPAGQGGSCLQTREYQTTVIIGGTPRDAYGTACLQPDGSWLQGPAIAAP